MDFRGVKWLAISSHNFDYYSNGIDAGSKHTAILADTSKTIPGSANSSDYDKSGMCPLHEIDGNKWFEWSLYICGYHYNLGNQSSNVDSGRGSAAYSSGRKAPQLDTEGSDSPNRDDPKNDDSEWVDIVDAELRHILEPGIQGLSIRPESTVSGSISSISPPLPPLSPDNSKSAIFEMPPGRISIISRFYVWNFSWTVQIVKDYKRFLETRIWHR